MVSSGFAKRVERQPKDGRSSEAGYVLAQTALLLIPLFIFAAFATDLGSWYVQSQKIQRGADAAALAGVTMMPDLAAAEQLARQTALLNGYADATPADNSDFDTGPLPQIRVTAPNSYSLEVEIRRSEAVYFAKLVMDDIVLERYGVAQDVRPVYMGNPTSGIGTGTLDPATLGQPNDGTWLSINGFCTDHEHGDRFLSHIFDRPGGAGMWACGTTPGSIRFPYGDVNPTFDGEGYAFVAEYAPSSPTIDIDLFEPGVCPFTNDTGWKDVGFSGPPIYYKLYGPSNSTDHEAFMDSNAPIQSGMIPLNACVPNSPTGDGWWPLATNLATPGANGGFYYVRIANRNPTNDPTGTYWGDSGFNHFSMRVLRSGDTLLCSSLVDPMCPQLHALEHLSLWRNLGGEVDFYLAEIDETHAGEKVLITIFDAAEGVENLQFADSNDVSMPFEWRYVDESVGGTTGPPYQETAFAPPGTTCPWGATSGNVCLDTSVRADFNDHFAQILIDVPPSYTCGADCWWKVRYTTMSTTHDRSTWSIQVLGDPVRLVE